MAKPRTGTGSTAAAGALPYTDAIDVLWGTEDERPLLVLRECTLCTGADDALLNRSLTNDRTQLMTKWFRCVRLPAHVGEPSHPLHNVFASFGLENQIPHFFLLAHPGAKPVAFTGTQTQGDLWKGIYDVLGQRYAGDAQRAAKDWLALLDHFDMLDSRRLQMQEQLDAVRATDGPESDKAKKLVADMKRTAEEYAAALKREKQISDLGLLKMPRAATPSAAGN